MANYRSRGYNIAISNFGRTELDFAFLAELRPDIVNLDNLLLASSRPLDRIIGNIHDLHAHVLIEGIDSANLRRNAGSLAIDLIQTHAPVVRPVGGIRVSQHAENWAKIANAA